MPEFHNLTINHLEKATENCVIIGFNIPNNLKDAFAFKAGQYITLKVSINSNEVRRDYSLCSAPKSGIIKVAVKEVEDGTFSKYANNDLKINDIIEVSEPRGRFIYTPEISNTNSVVAFAAGSGITPIMSIIKTVLQEENTSKMILVYGNKTPKDTIFFSEIIDLQTKYPNRFLVYFMFSQSQEDNSLFGRIETSTVNYIIKNKHKEDTFKGFYLCGPEAMITSVSEILQTNNVDKGSIFFELFTAPSTTNKSSNQTTSEGTTEITIMVDDEETSFTMSQKKSILEAALSEDIDAPYSCQGGICSSCLAKIKSGTATMRQNNILTDSEVEEGLILTCQAHPTSSKIYVDFDDV